MVLLWRARYSSAAPLAVATTKTAAAKAAMRLEILLLLLGCGVLCTGFGPGLLTAGSTSLVAMLLVVR